MVNPEHYNTLFSLAQDLIRIPSPPGQERDVAEYLQRTMGEMGFTEVQSDKYGNVIGRISFSNDGPVLLFEGHMDHVRVPHPEYWIHYPYGGEMSRGCLWGRGATDNKGALAAMISAASFLSRSGTHGLRGSLYVGASVLQEPLESVAASGIAELCHPDFVVVGEASGNAVMRGQRGRAEILLETKGQSVHCAFPHEGINAIRKMLRVASLIEKELFLPEEPVLGKGSMELTSIESSPQQDFNIVPNFCTAYFDRRLLLSETRDGVLADIQEILEEEALRDNAFRASVRYSTKEQLCYTGKLLRSEVFYPAWLLEENHPFVRRVCDGLHSMGLPCTLDIYPYSTNASYYAGVAGIPTVGFGPAQMSILHLDDEYIELDDLVRICNGYVGIAHSVLAT